jgi:HAD superfamily hydrolase (TIGR01490 family)
MGRTLPAGGRAPRSSTPAATAAPNPNPVGPTPGALVFMDFDNTLIDGDAGPLFGLYLFSWRRHELQGHPWRRMWMWMRYFPYILGMGFQLLFYKLGAVRRSTIVRASYKGLRGSSAAQFYGLMDGFAEEAVAPRIFPSMRQEIAHHLEAGHGCVVITTGMEGLIRKVLDRVDPRIDLIGCRMRERNGRLTGRVDGPLYGLDKANILHAYARAKGVPLQECWAYSDHWSDHQMLEAVGHGVAVNPRGRLRRAARRRGWTILEPRLTPPSSSAPTSTPTP